MKIDWFTAAAQIINLFILIWLLKKFLYRPVLEAMQQRQERINKSLKEAGEEKKAAEKEKKQYQLLQDKAEQEVREKLEQAGREAEEQRQRLMREVKEEEDEARRKWHKELEEEKERFLARTGRTIADEFGRLSRAAFRDLANRGLEEEMVKLFLEKTKSEPEKSILTSLRENGEERVQVTSSHKLDDSLRRQLREELREIWGRDIAVDFATDPDLLAGIIVEAEGRKVGWHLAQYLDDFQKRLKESLEQPGDGK